MSQSASPALPAPIRVEAPVVENQRQSGAGRRLVLRVPDWPGFAPGQFAMLSPRAAAPRSDPLLPRPMAVYRQRGPGGAGGAEVEILYKVVGRGTALLAAAAPGQPIGLVGPLGRGFPDPQPGERALLVAGGTGIASVYELARRLGSVAEVLLGARSAEELMGVEDFRALASGLHLATEDGSAGARGRVTELLEEALAGAGPARVYACGPTAMMRRAAELCAARRTPCVVSLETPMACGFGVCLGCAVPRRDEGFALVCREGPVFAAESLDWDGLP